MRSAAVRRLLAIVSALALVLGMAVASTPVALAVNATNTNVAGINVDTTTIPELETLMDHHRLNSVQLMQFYLHRIHQLNSELHAVIAVSPTALAQARLADAERRAGDDRPLLGMPIMVKDNIDTTGMATTAGSWALAGSTPADAFIVHQLKAAGAIVFAKANLSEWANFRSSPSSSGWSGIGGQTNMPYVLDRNPCGSSSGSGVAAAADLAVAAVGTETDGSIVCPSGANSDVGIKPTLGLLSRAGIVPISADQDSAGPIARNVTDAAVLLGAMTGVDANDPATSGQVGHAHTDYTPYLDAGALNGARIGVWRDGVYDATLDPSVTGSDVFDAALASIEDAGATTVPAEILPFTGPDADLTFSIYAGEGALYCEFKSDIASYLHTYAPSYPKGYSNDLQGLIDFNNDHPGLEGPWNSAVFDFAQSTNGRDQDCADLRATATPVLQQRLNDMFADNNLDAIVALTNGPAWVTDPVNGDLGGDFSTFVGSSSAAAISGYVEITVPAGYVGPLPVGITFFGLKWDEPKIIALAYAFEQATKVRVAPQFLSTWSGSAAPTRHSHVNGSKTTHGAVVDAHARWGLSRR
jgi:amidase